MLHAKALAVVVAYDMYLECSEGLLRAGEWKIEQPCSFHRFREKLSVQMIQYSPQQRKYVGDEKFRVYTQQHKKRCLVSSFLSSARSTTTSASTVSLDYQSGLTKADFTGFSSSRLCGDLTKLVAHVDSVEALPNKASKICVVCGDRCYFVCNAGIGPDGKKGVAMHRFPKKDGINVGNRCCFYHHHNTSFFGLGKNEHKLVGIKRKKEWTFPTREKLSDHREEVLNLLQPKVAVPALTATAPNNVNNNGGTVFRDSLGQERGYL